SDRLGNMNRVVALGIRAGINNDRSRIGYGCYAFSNRGESIVTHFRGRSAAVGIISARHARPIVIHVNGRGRRLGGPLGKQPRVSRDSEGVSRTVARAAAISCRVPARESVGGLLQVTLIKHRYR